jgi:hypothetical protein
MEERSDGKLHLFSFGVDDEHEQQRDLELCSNGVE